MLLCACAQAQYTFGPEVQSPAAASIAYDSNTDFFQYTDVTNTNSAMAYLPLAGSAAGLVGTSSGWTASINASLSATTLIVSGGVADPHTMVMLGIYADDADNNPIHFLAMLTQMNNTAGGDTSDFPLGFYGSAVRVAGGTYLPTHLGNAFAYGNADSGGECAILPLTAGTNASGADETVAATNGILTVTYDASTKYITAYFNQEPVAKQSIAGWKELSLVVGGGDKEVGATNDSITASGFSVSAYPPVLPQIVSTVSNPTNGGTTTVRTNTADQTITVTATPKTAKNFVFIDWTLDGAVVSTSNRYTFPLPGENVTLTANFGYTVSTSSSPADGGATTGGGSYVAGSNVTVNAEPNPCFEFVEWTEGGKAVSTSPVYMFALTNKVSLVAKFKQTDTNRYDISAISSPTNYGTVTGTGTNECGSTVMLKAHAKSGYAFVNWVDVDGGTVVGTNATLSISVSNSTQFQANFGFEVATSSSPADGGATVGNGLYLADATGVSVTAKPNPCFEFVKWTQGGKTVSTSPVYPITSGTNVTLVAEFTQIKYDVTAVSSPAVAGTVSGAGTNECGEKVTLRATAKTGFKFVNWVNVDGGAIVGTNTSLSVTVTSNASFQANFVDIQAPKLTVAAPTLGEKVGTAAFTISGTATDNLAVWYVAYSLNSNAWVDLPVGSSGVWSANVNLEPGKTNTLSVYAVDTSTNMSKTNYIRFVCTAAGYAPASLSGLMATVSFVIPTNRAPVEASFGPATIAESSTTTNEDWGAGTYTYTLTGSNTAQLVVNRTAPAERAGVNTNILTFSDAYDATFAKVDSTDTGSFAFSVAPNLVPATISGHVSTSVSATETSFVTTNTSGDGVFTAADSLGRSYGGTYTFTPYSPVMAVEQQVFTNPPELLGMSNFVLFTYTSDSPFSGYYDYVGFSASETNVDVGTFTAVEKTNKVKYVAPASIAGLEWTVESTGKPTFTLSFGDATFGQATAEASNTNRYGVGAYTYTRLGTNSAKLDVSYLPPFNLIHTNNNNTILLTFSSPTHAISTNEEQGTSSTITSATAPDTAPATIQGDTVSVTSTFNSANAKDIGTVTDIYSYGTWTQISKSATNAVSYTYAPISPNFALLTGDDNNYVELTFSSAKTGTFISTVVEDAEIKIEAGTFNIK
jgi:hypothetical protein